MTEAVEPYDVADESGAGRLRSTARERAVAGSIELLATYFADAPTWDLATRRAIAHIDRDLDVMASEVRLRVVLAAGRELEDIVRRILERPTFRYSRAAEESVGVLRGRLDVQRYVRSRWRPEAPRRYPIHVLRRRYLTPENVLAAACAQWIHDEMRIAPMRHLPPGAPERREIRERMAGLTRSLRQPSLAEASDEALDALRRRALGDLAARVEYRAQTGAIGTPEPHLELVRWVRTFRPDESSAVPGDVPWAFYDERFDPKLFEIWTLAELLEALRERFGDPTVGPRPLWERAAHPIAVWTLGALKIQAYFQASLSRITPGQPRWKYIEPDSRPLLGFPDIALVIDTTLASPSPVLIDPKLRERKGPPADELYKLLGYFGNLTSEPPYRGAIVYYSPGDVKSYRLAAEDDGSDIFALGVDPDLPAESREMLTRIVDLLASATGVPKNLLDQAARGDADEEAMTDFRQRAAVEAMLAAATELPAATLEPVRKSLSAQLHEVWDRLDDKSQTMIVTSEYFATRAPTEADHSGPLLGLAATCERVLFRSVYAHLVEREPERFSGHHTLGTMVYWLRDACRDEPRTPEGKLVRNQVAAPDDDSRGLTPCDLGDDLARLNEAFRIPAAHREVVDQGLWVQGRAFVLAADGLLERTVHALSPGA